MKLKTLIGGFFGIWVLWMLFCLAVLGGVIYVAVHFIQKYW